MEEGYIDIIHIVNQSWKCYGDGEGSKRVGFMSFSESLFLDDKDLPTDRNKNTYNKDTPQI